MPQGITNAWFPIGFISVRAILDRFPDPISSFPIGFRIESDKIRALLVKSGPFPIGFTIES